MQLQTILFHHVFQDTIWVKCPSCANVNRHSHSREGHRVCDQTSGACPGYILKSATKVKVHNDWQAYQRVLRKEEHIVLPGSVLPRKKQSCWGHCSTCDKEHNFAVSLSKITGCVPSANVIQFDDIVLPKDYRAALHEAHPNFTVDEVVGCCLGLAPKDVFLSIDEFKQEKKTKRSGSGKTSKDRNV